MSARFEQKDFETVGDRIVWPNGTVPFGDLMLATAASDEVKKPVLIWGSLALMVGGVYVFTLESRWFWQTFGDALSALEGNIGFGLELSEMLSALILAAIGGLIAWRMTKAARGPQSTGLLILHLISGQKLIVRTSTKAEGSHIAMRLMRELANYYKKLDTLGTTELKALA
ncbi:hypothetical protein roselon_01951 [Roseibacterium elongatum DSM 19469]|uniref:Uncharacterized protein n=1 Tax=Roseicyclus elongatus DSM 19469 TaxID=1294273 RepID=W8RT36_9RHOB|nr:hypothetical protein [Roseibacterium elongatum]AHM04308.1 hypothetical protein roselon_01951 [Roseibacterium elongatum DSM 19469]